MLSQASKRLPTRQLLHLFSSSSTSSVPSPFECFEKYKTLIFEEELRVKDENKKQEEVRAIQGQGGEPPCPRLNMIDLSLPNYTRPFASPHLIHLIHNDSWLSCNSFNVDFYD